MSYQAVIGLEIHIELKTGSKMFCPCLNDPNERHPNINVCPVCVGHPGTLPVINEEAVKKTIKTGLALNCQIPEYSKFDRKNYFYPDLPKGYQISQYDKPLCNEGYLEIDGRKIRIRRVHLEEDTGRLIHEEWGGVKLSPEEAVIANKGSGKEYEELLEKYKQEAYSLVDFNRAGIPLMESVTEPDLRSAKETRKFAEELQLILRYLNVSDADMEKGEFRVEANISLRPKMTDKLGTKVEIKNLNSFRAVEKALDYEIQRQAEILKSGKKVIQETRGWDDAKQKTMSQREKEEAHDYRYFPEPDLPLLHITQKMIAKIRAEIPELPQRKRERFKREYKLDEKSIEFFVLKKDLGEYFEKVISEFDPRLPHEKIINLIKITSNYIITDLQGLLKGASVSGEDFLITPENFAEFIMLIHRGEMSSKIAKQVLGDMFKTGADPSNIIKEKGLTLITDETEIEKIIKTVLAKNQKVVSDFKKGKANAFQYLIGKVMTESRGKANPELASKILKRMISD